MVVVVCFAIFWSRLAVTAFVAFIFAGGLLAAQQLIITSNPKFLLRSSQQIVDVDAVHIARAVVDYYCINNFLFINFEENCMLIGF